MPEWSSVKLFLSRRLVAGRLPLNPLRNTGRQLNRDSLTRPFSCCFSMAESFLCPAGKIPSSKNYKNQNLIMKKTLVELNSQGIVYERHTEWVSHLGLTQLRDCVSFLNAAHFFLTAS
jgi:hypothetical protein